MRSRIFLVSALILFFSACEERAGDSSPVNKHSKPQIVVSTGMLADAVRNIAGDSADVIGLMGTGIDPHLYKPTRSDIAKLNAADIVFYNGLYLEGRMIESFSRLSKSGKAVYAVGEKIDSNVLLSPKGGGEHYDPHIWMDPKIWSLVVSATTDALIEQIPEEGDAFRQNASLYLSKLVALDAYAEKVLSSVEARARVLVTAHDAFGYFGRRYDYEVLGIQGISTESEAGIRDIERIVSKLTLLKIPAVFVESTVSERNVRALIEGAASTGHEVRIGGELFSDAMGQAGTKEGTYLGMIEHNVNTIASALGGKVPDDGFHYQAEAPNPNATTVEQ